MSGPVGGRHTPLLVIGGGPGGYPAAFHAADHGLRVILVDEGDRPGGVCLHRGCIPSKALLHVAKVMAEAEHLARAGVHFPRPRIDLDTLRAYVQNEVVGRLAAGIEQLAKARKVELVRDRAVFTNSTSVQLQRSGEQIRFDHAIIATGSVPAMPAPFAVEDKRVMDSTGALALERVPGRLLVIGGGYIGLEMGAVYHALGSRVVVVEFLDGLLPGADRDLVRPLDAQLRSRFEAIHVSTRVEAIRAGAKGLRCSLTGPDGSREELFDAALVAVGRRPNSFGLGLENTSAELDDRGFIRVDGVRRTTDPRLFAIGDVAGEPGLAHKATAEARVAVGAILGEPVEFAPRAIPAVVFTDPEVAWCGLTEREAADQGLDVRVHRFPWAASGRAISIGHTEGLTKLVVDPESGRVLGVGMVGAGAGDLIAEGVMAVEMGAVARDVAESIHPHPTLSETLMEAAEMALGHATHALGRRA